MCYTLFIYRRLDARTPYLGARYERPHEADGTREESDGAEERAGSPACGFCAALALPRAPKPHPQRSDARDSWCGSAIVSDCACPRTIPRRFNRSDWPSLPCQGWIDLGSESREREWTILLTAAIVSPLLFPSPP